MKARNINVDAIKGLSMILIALGHACLTRNDANELLHGPFVFLMPVFMMISGYYSYSATRKNDAAWILSRTKTLLIPFISWIVITMYLNFNFDFKRSVSFLIDVIKQPDKSNWFLFCLFQLSFVLFLCNLLIEKINIDKYSWVVYVFVIAVSKIMFYKFNFQILGMFSFQLYSFFFLLAYVCHKYDVLDIVKPILFNKIVKIILIVTGLIFTCLFRKMSEPLYDIYIKMYVNSYLIQKVLLILVSFIAPLVSSYMFVVLVYALPDIIKKKLAFLGTISLEIYILHRYFFFNFCENNWIVDVLLKTFSGILFSVIVTLIVERGDLSSFIFGRPEKKRS